MSRSAIGVGQHGVVVPTMMSDDEVALARPVVEALQASLLPSVLPEVPGLRFFAGYRAGMNGTQLGGDWYDVVSLRGGGVLVSVGDVVGRGASAATAMGRLRTEVKIYAFEGFSPAQILDRVNGHACDIHDPVAASVLVIVLDPHDRSFVYANAGHPPAVLRTPQHDVALVAPPTGPPVGLLPRASFAQDRCEMPPGGTLVLYTDGLVKHRGAPLDEGMSRLLDAVAGGPEDGGRLAAQLLEGLDTRTRHDGATLHDDVALLVVGIEPWIAPLRVRVKADPRALAFVRHAVALWLRRAGVHERQVTDMLLAVNEAVANAVEHAYGPRDGEVAVDGDRAGDEVKIRVDDSGRWRGPRDDGGGLGLGLMRQLVDDVAIETSAGGTTVILRTTIQRDDEVSAAHGSGDIS